MSDEIMLVFGEDGVAREYDDTWDITIHCESEEEQKLVWEKLKNSNQEAKTQLSAEGTTSDLISRRVAVDALWEIRQEEISDGRRFHDYCSLSTAVDVIKDLPSAQPEPLTDKEQRIFLAAMGREEKVCEEVDRNYVREPYEDSLVRVCKEIRRKVKGALWI